ncbi:hypothetical protein LJB71_15035 [Thermomonas sp. S9]|uniref:hypothetical protein n=1 Tax=Thermomonas sp. S9 TaxID=2885203 RepID=UPI00216AB59E|nr:hypothetical protein [Thermomonas sp. S9]MCR6497394.1 hypothetical protein [Thermomonas sp. S9]
MIELVEAEAIGRAPGPDGGSVRRRAAAENWPTPTPVSGRRRVYRLADLPADVKARG